MGQLMEKLPIFVIKFWTTSHEYVIMLEKAAGEHFNVCK